MHSSKKPSLVINTNTTVPKILPKSNNMTPTTCPPSETEIKIVAQVAYTKLVTEASLKDQRLRRLVGHANLYDKLLDEFNNSNCASSSSSDSESESESESDNEATIEELANQAFATSVLGLGLGVGVEVEHSSKPQAGGVNTVVIHEEDTTCIYQDQVVAGGGKFVGGGGDVLVLIEESEEEEALYKVASSRRSSDAQNYHARRFAEVEVKELEVWDDE